MRLWFTLLCLLPCLGGATELLPWFGEDLAFELRLQGKIAYYNRVDTDNGIVVSRAMHHYGSTGLSFAFDDMLSAEVEMGGARLEERPCSVEFDFMRLTGRYLVMNDVAGDFLSIILGVSATAADGARKFDLIRRYHGFWNGELHLAVGKEWTCGPEWTWRVWTLAAYGIADQGREWLRAAAGIERNFYDKCRLRLWAEGMGGFGEQPLDVADFRGYGGIAHRSVDMGLRFTYSMGIEGEIAGEWGYRPYARNTPMELQWGAVTVLWYLSVL